MDRQLQTGNTFLIVKLEEPIDTEQILADWLSALTSLHSNYMALHSYIHQSGQQSCEPKETDSFIGQCPVSQMVRLSNRMYCELEKLVQDMDMSGKPDGEKNYKKLAAHTLVIKQLNQQATLSFQLLSLSAS